MIKNYDKLHLIPLLQEALQQLENNAPNVDKNILEKIASFCYAIQSSETPLTQSLPDFPSDSLKYIAQIIDNNPNLSILKAIYRLYPFNTFLSNESTSSIYTLFKELNIPIRDYATQEKVANVTKSKNDDNPSLNEYIGRSLSIT